MVGWLQTLEWVPVRAMGLALVFFGCHVADRNLEFQFHRPTTATRFGVELSPVANLEAAAAEELEDHTRDSRYQTSSFAPLLAHLTVSIHSLSLACLQHPTSGRDAIAWVPLRQRRLRQ